ncbi:MAG: hypothetical protein HY812_16485 [Planctomycetes bacterium]|nr:hypothetical protein [Planctomycetota bacterium]
MSSGNLDVSVGGVAALVQSLLAIGVYGDVEKRRRRRLETRFGGRWTWAAATLILGVFGLGAYWVIHYSTFAAKSEPPETKA